MNISILHSKVLVVEGKDDQGFFAAFLKHLGIDGVQVEPVGGKDNLRPNLKALRNTPGFSNVEFLGVVRDADTNARGAFQSVRDALKGAGLGFPRRAATPVGRSPRVAVLILPGSGSRGELEDVCLGAVRNDPALRAWTNTSGVFGAQEYPQHELQPKPKCRHFWRLARSLVCGWGRRPRKVIGLGTPWPSTGSPDS